MVRKAAGKRGTSKSGGQRSSGGSKHKSANLQSEVNASILGSATVDSPIDRFRQTKNKGTIILFGAYANGNIGDMYQANAVAYHFNKHAPTLSVFATSNSSANRPYEYELARQIGPESAIADSSIINEYGALVIGGGGLLASVHRPLNSEQWVKKLKLPVVLFAVGASPEIAEKCQALIERADIVTARDSFSLDVLLKYRKDVTLLNDPILADDRLNAENMAYSGDVHRICVIPRKQTAKNFPVYQALAAQLKNRDRIVSMFPATDTLSGALANFESSRPIETWKMSELTSAIDSCSNVVSERYHGCIVALKRLVPTLGFINSDDEKRSKIGEFYHQIGHSHLLVNYRQTPLTRADIVAKLQSEFDLDVFRSSLKVIQEEFDTSLKKLIVRMGIESDA